MANWLINCEYKYIFRIYQRMKEIILTIRYVHCYETRVQVLDEANQKASTENWMWVYRTGELSDAPQMALFSYARTRGAYHPKEFLDGYAGYLTYDGYQAYHGLSDEITVTGCMSHCRRRFEPDHPQKKISARKS